MRTHMRELLAEWRLDFGGVNRQHAQAQRQVRDSRLGVGPEGHRLPLPLMGGCIPLGPPPDGCLTIHEQLVVAAVDDRVQCAPHARDVGLA